jgi:hypothetical protein
MLKKKQTVIAYQHWRYYSRVLMVYLHRLRRSYPDSVLGKTQCWEEVTYKDDSLLRERHSNGCLAMFWVQIGTDSTAPLSKWEAD